ncbi:hypothetical protein NQ176_g8531 [Zarea fungicola]|uniref:Uncharacterized protein n=1 Tax=Zarea fungicola TaxID=93591 RepID=A0ACC1MRS0_9HYPO|nr:hypothetical protein NQ176_g8531 [Lecanicillium fungicola]
MAHHTLERLVPHRYAQLTLEDNENTMDDLIERLNRTQAILQQIDATELEAADLESTEFESTQFHAVKFEVPRPGMGGVTTDRTGYALGFILPNLFFHTTVAYGILRKEGVPVGKTDYWLPFLYPQIVSKEW